MTVNFFLHLLGEHAVRRHIHFSPPRGISGCLVVSSQQEIDDSIVYIGDAKAALKLLKQASGTAVTVISIGDSEGFRAYEEQSSVNLIVSDLSLPELCNLMMEAVNRYHRWIYSLQSTIYTNTKIDELINLGAKMLDCHVFLLNAGNKLTAYNSDADFHSFYSEELLENGYLSYKSIKEITKREFYVGNDTNDMEPTWMEYRSDHLQHHVIMHLIKYKSNVVARLLIIIPLQRYDPAIRELANVLRKYVCLFIERNYGESYRTSNELSLLVGDIIETKIANMEELNERLEHLPIYIKKYYHGIVVEFEKRPTIIPYGQIIDQLEKIFPYSNFAVYKGDIVILARKVQHYLPLDFDKEHCNKILQTYDAYACVGNYSKWLTTLRPIYLQTKEALRFAKLLSPDKDNRIYDYEDYSMFHMIDLLAENCYDYHHNNLVYLCHPDMMSLERHDLKYGTNYRILTYTYLMNNCRLSKTAEDLQLHRNTVANKISHIEEIIGDKLNNGLLQQRLMFSHLVLEYVNKYQSDDVFKLK